MAAREGEAHTFCNAVAEAFGPMNSIAGQDALLMQVSHIPDVESLVAGAWPAVSLKKVGF